MYSGEIGNRIYAVKYIRLKCVLRIVILVFVGFYIGRLIYLLVIYLINEFLLNF